MAFSNRVAGAAGVGNGEGAYGVVVWGEVGCAFVLWEVLVVA